MLFPEILKEALDMELSQLIVRLVDELAVREFILNITGVDPLVQKSRVAIPPELSEFTGAIVSIPLRTGGIEEQLSKTII